MPADEAEKSGLAPDQVKINEKYGGGYPANLEGLHHLHCLVRMTLQDKVLCVVAVDANAAERISFARPCTGTMITTALKARAHSQTTTISSVSMPVSTMK